MIEIEIFSLSFFYLFHIFVSSVISFFGVYLVKKRFETSKKKIWFFFFVFNISLPLVGYILTFLIGYYLAHVRYETVLNKISYIDMSEFEKEFPKVERIFGEGSMERILKDDLSLGSYKMKALVSLSESMDKEKVRLIKSCLSDKNDEIRLYSFALIDTMERTINGKIYEKAQAFTEVAEETQKIEIAESLVYLYWDLVYYELSDENLQAFVLAEVERYATMVLSHYPHHVKINLIQGQTLMMAKKYLEAEMCFATILSDGYARSHVAPFLARIRFENHDFLETRDFILNEGKMLYYDATYHPLYMQWSHNVQR